MVEEPVAGMIDLRRTKRITLRAITPGLVRNLRGFVKGHEIPDRVNSAAKKFIARLAAEEIRADIDSTFQAVRQAFGFKRKELEASSEGSAGYLRTPRFEYRVQVDLDPNDPTSVIWQREISELKNFSLIGKPEFQTAFGCVFDMLVFELRKPINVANLIDEIEENETRGVRVICPSDAAWCEIAVGGFRGAIRVEPAMVRIEGRRAPPLPSLFDQFLQFLAR